MAGQSRTLRRRAAACRIALPVLLAALLAACAPALVPAPRPGSPAPVPAPIGSPATSAVLPAATLAWYQQAAGGGATVLRIDPQASVIVATVRRGGALARLGHDHVVASHAIDGLVAASAGRADFGFRLDTLTVDEPDLRLAAQLDTTPSADAIAGTRANMLGRVLDAERYPLVLLQVASTTPLRTDTVDGAAAMSLQVTLHGVTRSLPASVQLTRTADTLTASGTLQLRQSDFGITPMSVLGGAMTVADTLELRYRIVARPR